jgi:outer membrane protein assembly factor BamB
VDENASIPPDDASARAAERAAVAAARRRTLRRQRLLIAASLAVLVAVIAVIAGSGGGGRRSAPRATRVPISPTLLAYGFGQALQANPGSIRAYNAAARLPGLPGYLLIADRGNNRVLVVNPHGDVVWRYPTASDLAAGRRLRFNDDTFVVPGGQALIANEEDNSAIVSIGIADHNLHVVFGQPGVRGGGAMHLNYPDDAYALADGSVTVADAYNCRILFVRAGAIVRQYGHSGVCRHDPPAYFGSVNGDTPTPDGGVLVSEISGHWVDSIAADGTLRYAVRAPAAYPSDPQPLPNDHVLLADYSRPGRVLVTDRLGDVLWQYGPPVGPGRLDHPSLALELPNGDIAVNDDYRHRVVVIDPSTRRIVWQYGHTDQPGTKPGYLNTPDGMDFVPAGPDGQPDWAAVVHP